MDDIKRPAFPLTGGCPCGAIRYEVTAMPLGLYACHCTDCQRKSGAAFALNMPVATQSFRIVQGTPKGWHNAGASGEQTISWFCADCGGRLYGERPTRPDAMTVRAGTLDDTSWLRPAAHLFIRSAQPWEVPLQAVMSGDAGCFETMPDDFAPLVKAWRMKMGEA